MKILSTGERIRLVRRSLKMTIDELGGSKYTTTYILKLENNELNPHKDTISDLVKNLNRKISESKRNVQLSSKYFLSSERDMADIRFHIYIELLRNKLDEITSPCVFKILNWCLSLSSIYNLDGKGDVYFFKGYYYRKIGLHRCAQSHYRHALDYFRDNNDSEMYIKICLILGNLSYAVQDYTLAQYHYEEAYYTSCGIKNNPRMYKILYNLSLVSSTLKNSQKALKFLKLIEKNFYNETTFNFYILKINILVELNNIDEAINYLHKFKVKKLDTDKKALLYNNLAMILLKKEEFKLSLKYAQKGLSLKKKIVENTSNELCYYYDTVSLAYFYQDKYKQAIKYSNRTLSLTSDNTMIVDAYMIIAKSKIALEEYLEAEEYLDKIINIATIQEFFDKLAEAYSCLSKIHYQLGNFHQADIFSKSSLKWQTNFIAN